MSNPIESIWQSSSNSRSSTLIMPDGCRDLILKVTDQQQPQWFVSPLFNHAKSVSTEACSTLTGFRLKPGIRIDENDLLKAIGNNVYDTDEILHRIADFTDLDSGVDEALQCLARDSTTVKQTANRLGVSTRTLQRRVLQITERTPAYWLQLARARKAARSLSSHIPLAETACQHSYSDQAHMSREFKRWFHLTPTELLNSPNAIEQLRHSGYA